MPGSSRDDSWACAASATFGMRARPDPTAPESYTEGLWGFLLEDLPGDQTRLVVSGYQTLRPRWLEGPFNFLVYPLMHWPMQTRQFATIKRNVETARNAATDGQH